MVPSEVIVAVKRQGSVDEGVGEGVGVGEGEAGVSNCLVGSVCVWCVQLGGGVVLGGV